MGILDGISAGLTAATKAATGAAQGQQQGSQLLRAIQMQGLDAQEKRAMIAMNTARAESFMHSANQPPPATIHQLADGTLVSVDHLGKATPVTMGGGGAPSVAQTPTPPSVDGNGPTGDVDLGKPDAPPQATPQQPVALKGHVPVDQPAVGSPAWRQAKIEEAKIGAQYGYHPPVQPQLITSVGPDGKPVYGVFDKHTRAIQPVDASGLTPKGPASGGGQNAPQMAASKANLDAARQVMNEYEDRMKAGTAHIGVLGASEGAMASSPDAITAKGPMGAAMSVLANAAGSHLQHSDPDLARYLTAKKYVAEAILNTHKRPNQTQYEIEQELSGAGPGATPQQIDMGRERRDRMYNEVFANPNAGAVSSGAATPPAIAQRPAATYPGRKPLPARGGAPKPTASQAQTLWDAAVALHGKDKVLAEYGPRPPQ